MTDIQNYDIYNDRMRRSMWDKAFFMDKIPGATLLVDYGCADGSLIRFLHGLFPSMRMVGYDIDPFMVEKANTNKPANTWFFHDPEELLACIRRMNVPTEEIAVNFSSLMHELFHYGFDRTEFQGLMDAVNPRYIIVRDMFFRCEDAAKETSPDACKLLHQALPPWMIHDFEQCHGSITLLKNAVHLLMKYKYMENWPRECAENYFPYTRAQLADLLRENEKYHSVLESYYTLPWLREDIADTLRLDAGSSFTTHISLILRRTPEESLIPLTL
ncbi:MAG: hypothetical protein E7331_10440 [Clostridiales bacterium]|nr:hypothetical protein [Clostridiales bacterium]